MSDDALRAHLSYFEELGVDGVRRDPAWGARAASRAVSPTRAEAEAAAPVRVSAPDRVLGAPEPDATTPATDALAAHDAPSAAPGSAMRGARTVQVAADALRGIRVDIGEDCSRCKLHTLGRTQIVFGVGNPMADLMFVGEAPGADEDIKGEPFVGRAGQLLTKIIEAIGLSREDVYIANLIKCRPPGNRNPEPDEMAQCEPFLFRQIDTIRPAVVVALGKFAAQALLRTTEPITRIRGREYAYRDAVLIPTYHPAYLLRNPSAKRDVWDDMKRVREILASRPRG